MKCFVYRSSKKDGLYVYLPSREALTELPDAVMTQLGTPELALEFELTPGRKLQSEDADTVINNLKTSGYHIQMPSDLEPLLSQFLQADRKG